MIFWNGERRSTVELNGSQLLMTALVGVFTLNVGAWAWLLRRWVSKADSLHQEVETLRLNSAVKDERISNLAGAVETLRRTVADQATTIGQLAATVDKLWTVLQAKGLVELRASDEALANRRPKR